MPKPAKIERELVFRDRVFPLDVSTWENHPDYPLVTHEFREIVVVVRGTATKLVGRHQFPLKPGDVFALDGESPHGYRDTRDLTVINITYDPVLLEAVKFDVAGLPGYQEMFVVEPTLRACGGYAHAMHLDMAQLEKVMSLAQTIEKELHLGNSRRPAVRYQDRHLTAISLSDAPPQDRGSQFMAMANFMALVGLLSRWRFAKPTLDSEKTVNIGRAISHLERHYDEPLDLAALATMSGMSNRNFYRIFHTVTGQTPSSYLQQLRISKAAQILRTTDKTVTEVAFQCGFLDSSYFARCFRQRFGVSPRESKRRPTA